MTAVPKDVWLALLISSFCLACSDERSRGPAAGAREILFTSQRPGQTEDVNAMDVASGSTRLIVAGDSISSRNLAVWSRDSRRVAFVRELGVRSELYVWSGPDQAPVRVGPELPDAVLFPDWSPTGDRILVSAGRTPRHIGIYRVDVASNATRVVRSDSLSYRCASWAPTGDRFVVGAYAGGQSSILVMDTMGVILDRVVASDTTFLDCPQWSPTRHEILHTIFHGGGQSGWERPAFHSNLAVVDLTTRAVRQITSDHGLTNYGRWSHDGEWVVFQSDRHAAPTTNAEGIQQLFRNLEIWIMHRSGTGMRRLTANDYFDAHPSW